MDWVSLVRKKKRKRLVRLRREENFQKSIKENFLKPHKEGILLALKKRRKNYQKITPIKNQFIVKN